MVGLKALPELGGLVNLSGFHPRVRDVSSSQKNRTCIIRLICTEANDRELRLPILWCHGTNADSMGEDAISFMRDKLHILDPAS